MTSCAAVRPARGASNSSYAPAPAPSGGRRLCLVPKKPKQDQPHTSGEESPKTSHRGTGEPANVAPPASDRQTRDPIVLQHLPLVRAIASRILAAISARVPVQIDLEDLIQAGIVGLIHAAAKYDATKQVAFSAYAKHRIHGAILDSLRELDWASRDMRRRQKALDLASSELSATLHRTPTETEMAEKLGIDLPDLRHAMMDLQARGSISVSFPLHQDEDLPPVDFPCSPENHPDRICERKQVRAVLDEAMKDLPPQYRAVVSMYYTNEMSMKQIGLVLAVNESRISQIHKSALAKIALLLQANGITGSRAILG